jgi:hypothetical protein
MAFATLPLAQGEEVVLLDSAAPIYQGSCTVATTGKKGSDVHSLTKLQDVSLSDNPAEGVELYRSAKATVKVFARKNEDREKSTVEIVIRGVKEDVLYGAAMADYSGTTQSLELVAPNVSDLRGPDSMMVLCFEKK